MKEAGFVNSQFKGKKAIEENMTVELHRLTRQ